MKDVNTLAEQIVSSFKIELLLQELIYQTVLTRVNGDKEEATKQLCDSLSVVEKSLKEKILTVVENQDTDQNKNWDNMA